MSIKQIFGDLLFRDGQLFNTIGKETGTGADSCISGQPDVIWSSSKKDKPYTMLEIIQQLKR